MDDFTDQIARVLREDDVDGAVDAALVDVRRRADARRRTRTIGVVAAAAASVAVIVGVTVTMGGEPTDVPLGPATEAPNSDDVVPWSDRTDFKPWETPTAPPGGWLAEAPVRWDGLSAEVTLPEAVRAGETLEYVVTLTNHWDTDIDLAPCGGYRQSLVGQDMNSNPIWDGVQSEYRLNCDDDPILRAGTSRFYAVELDVPDDAPSLSEAHLEWQLIDTSPDQRGQGFLAVDGEGEPTDVQAQPDDPGERLVADFVHFAHEPSPRTLAGLPFADSVDLGLGPTIVRSADRDELAERAAWTLDQDLFRAYTGPFNALQPLRDRLADRWTYVTSVGSHPHCASPPVPAPEGYANHRRVSLQPSPEHYDSCLQWFTVDLFLNAANEIEAVTLDIYEP